MSAAENTGLFKMHIIIWVCSNIYFLSKLFLTDMNSKTSENKRQGLKKIHNLKLRPHLLQPRTFFLLTLQLHQQATFPPLVPIFIFSPSNSIGRPNYNASHSNNPDGVFSKLARPAHFPKGKMPLIDFYVETAAGDQNHCAPWVIIL